MAMMARLNDPAYKEKFEQWDAQEDERSE